MRFVFPALCVLAVAACDAPVPDSGAGVGFDNYDGYAARREMQLTGGGGEVTVRPPQDSGPGGGVADVPAGAGPASGVSQPLASINNPGISDEQSFEAVASRESIQSDRERLEAQRELYRVIPPEPLPARSGGSGPNVVEYALSTTNRVGQALYRRSGSKSAEALARRCARYISSDQAQIAFLQAGGPQRDRHGLDPDGDGFACYWDPQPFRLARGG